MKQFWQGRRIPLSWLLLSRQPVRLLVALDKYFVSGLKVWGAKLLVQLGVMKK